jgi:hypothetical protein
MVQDGPEVYLTFASYPAEYRRYLNKDDGAMSPNAYMRMQTYGPWKINNRDHMAELSQLIVAVTWLASCASP